MEAGIVAMKLDESIKTNSIIDLTSTWNKLDNLLNKMKNTSKLVSFNSPTFLAYVLIAPAVIYLLGIVGWPLI